MRAGSRGSTSVIMVDHSEPTVRAALERAMGPVEFSDLRPHLARDSVFIVTGTSLLDAGVAIATNDVRTVERLLATSALRRPTADEQRGWSEDPERRWIAIVVQPFVLIEEAGRHAPGGMHA
jgi:hypothetical protein